MPTAQHVMLLLALAALTSSNACLCSSTPTSSIPTSSTPSETTSSAPAPTTATTTPTTPSETTSSPSTPTDSDCRRLTWLGGQEGDRTQEVKLKLEQEQRQVLMTWAGGSMRLTRSPKDLRAFAGPWTADTDTSSNQAGQARLNFKEPFTTASGFWILGDTRTRRRLLLAPCTP